MSQTWNVTLLLAQPAVGYGNNISAGYGSASAAQAWPITLLDGSARGYGNNTSSGYGDAESVGAATWYTLDVTVLLEGATRPFYATLDLSQVLAPLDLTGVTAPLDVSQVTAPLDVVVVYAPLDMETEV